MHWAKIIGKCILSDNFTPIVLYVERFYESTCVKNKRVIPLKRIQSEISYIFLFTKGCHYVISPSKLLVRYYFSMLFEITEICEVDKVIAFHPVYVQNWARRRAFIFRFGSFIFQYFRQKWWAKMSDCKLVKGFAYRKGRAMNPGRSINFVLPCTNNR